MDPDELPSAARCQSCHTLTSRKCSVCNVCIYCSAECEAKAATLCFADVACKLHRDLPYEDTNIGSAAAHFLMLPSTQTDLTHRASPQLRWTALHNAAVHYLHILLACSPSRLFQKTAFGIAAVLTPEFRYSCGCQRIRFLGKTSQAAAKIVTNMGKLALAQMGEERIKAPRLRDKDGARDERQAVIVSGFVAKAHNEPSYVMHFDSIYVTHANNVWTVRRVQPLWAQKLTPLDHKLYTMSFKPDGCVPPKERHPLALVESALNPPPPAAAPTAAPEAMPPLRLPPSVAEATETMEVTEPLSVATAMGAAQAMAAQSSRATPRVPPLLGLPPEAEWADYLEAALDQAGAQEEAPPVWMAQAERAVQQSVQRCPAPPS